MSVETPRPNLTIQVVSDWCLVLFVGYRLNLRCETLPKTKANCRLFGVGNSYGPFTEVIDSEFLERIKQVEEFYLSRKGSLIEKEKYTEY